MYCFVDFFRSEFLDNFSIQKTFTKKILNIVLKLLSITLPPTSSHLISIHPVPYSAINLLIRDFKSLTNSPLTKFKKFTPHPAVLWCYMLTFFRLLATQIVVGCGSWNLRAPPPPKLQKCSKLRLWDTKQKIRLKTQKNGTNSKLTHMRWRKQVWQ